MKFSGFSLEEVPIMRRRIRLFSLLVLQFLGLSVFLKGFFPLKKAIPGSASFLEVPPEPGSAERGHGVPAVFDRFVFVLIDALRADFVFENTAMTYTRNLIKNNNTLRYALRFQRTYNFPGCHPVSPLSF